MKKSVFLLALAAQGIAFADTNTPNATSDMASFPAGTPMQQITPNAAPVPQWWANPYITVDFIYWKTSEGGLDYAFDGVAPSTPPVINAKKGKFHSPEQEYDPGFKVGFGLNFKHDGWDFFTEYTRLHSDHEHDHVHAHENNVLLSTWLLQLPGGVVTQIGLESASAKWHMNFDMLDFELGRNYYISKFLTLRPYVGIKLIWTDQHYNVNYVADDITFQNTDRASIKMTQDVMGTGIQAGLDAAWHMTKNWSVFGNFSLAGLWNDFDNSRKDYQTVDSVTQRTLNNKNDQTLLQPYFDFILGVQYETWFYHDYYHFGIHAGWEEVLLPNHNQLIGLYNEVSGDLGFQGLTIQARFDF